MSGNDATVDKCNISSGWKLVLTAFVYGILVCLLFTFCSIKVHTSHNMMVNPTFISNMLHIKPPVWSGQVLEIAASQEEPKLRYILQSISEAFSIGFGWSIYNLLSTTIQCEFEFFYDTQIGQIALLVIFVMYNAAAHRFGRLATLEATVAELKQFVLQLQAELRSRH